MPNVIFLLPGFECQISMTNKKWKWLSLMLWPTLKPIAEGLILIKGTSKDQYSPGTYKHSLPSFYIHIWLTLNSHLSQLCMCDWCDVKLDMLRAFLLEFFGISKEIQSFLSLTLIKKKKTQNISPTCQLERKDLSNNCPNLVQAASIGTIFPSRKLCDHALISRQHCFWGTLVPFP